MAAQLSKRAAKWLPSGLYLAGLALLGSVQLRHGLAPGRFRVWAGICELTGFVLVAAWVGWAGGWRPSWHGRPLAADEPRADTGDWFCWAQAGWIVVSIGLIFWILLDPAFDALGHGIALFGLAGRMTACPAALMLLGTTIVMAWQSRGRWRAAWQYASFAIAVLVTSSVGWARLDPAADALWHERSKYVLISVSMMTLLTWFGLARVLPWSGDWIVRARRAALVFAGLAFLLASLVLIVG